MLGAIDVTIFNFINKTMASSTMDMLMKFITNLGSGEFIFLLGVILIIFAKKDKRLSGILLLTGLTAAYFGVDFIKNAIAFPRPFIAILDTRLLIAAPTGYSFPSGHAAMVFMAAFVLSRFFRARVAYFAIASIVAFSRIYVGVHFMSDVIAGAILGLIIGYGVIKAADRAIVI